MSNVELFPQQDPFTYTTQNINYINFEWLFDLILYQVHKLSGMKGLFLLKLALIGAMIWSLLRSLTNEEELKYARARSVMVALALLLFALPLLKLRLVIRPHLMGYALLLITIQICRDLHRASRRDSPNRTRWISLFILTAVWVNSHGSWPLAFGVSGLFFVCFSQTRGIFAKTLGVQLVSVLINPYGAKLLWVPFSHLGSSPVHQWIEEWMAPSHLLLGYQLVLALTFAVLFLVLILGFRRRSDLPEVILATLLGILAIRSYRFLAPALLVAIPPMASRLSALIGKRHKPKRWVVGSLASGALFSALFSGQQRQIHPRSIEWNQRGLPVSAAGFIVDQALPGPLFNDFDVGDYLCWPLGSKVQHAIDGRVDLFGEEGLRDYVGLLQNPEHSFRTHVHAHGVQMVLLGWTVPRNIALVRWLQADRDFALVHLDEGYAVWARDVARRITEEKRLVLDRIQPALTPFDTLIGPADAAMSEQIARIRASSSKKFAHSVAIEWLWKSASNDTRGQSGLNQLIEESNALLDHGELAPVVRLHARTRRGQALLRMGKAKAAILDLEPAARAFRRLGIERPSVDQDLKRAQNAVSTP
jgi:hypothetical protein